jgi:hypothetical protein
MLEKAIKHPVASWAIGIGIALIPASFASAGLNNIWVARIWLCFVVLAIGLILFTTSVVESVRFKSRLLILTIVAIGCLAVERLETYLQPKPPQPIPAKVFPMPPIGLMMRPGELFTTHYPINIPEENLIIDYVDFPESGYAGFTNKNETDDVMFAIGGFDIRNTSKEKMKLNWKLRIDGEGKNFELAGDGHGQWQRQLNVNDFTSSHGDKETLSWLLSPVELEPGKRVHGTLGFVAPQVDSELRRLIAEGQIDRRYKAELLVSDSVSGRKFILELPFGQKPVVNEALKKRVQELSDQ